MCDTILKGLHNATCGIWNGIQATSCTLANGCVVAAKEAGKGIAVGYNWVGRNVEQLAHKHLHPTVAKIVASTVWALPYTVVSAILPPRLHEAVAGIGIGLWQQAGNDIDEFMGKTTREHAYTGLRNGSLIQACFSTAQLVTTGNWFMLLPIIANVFFAIQSHVIAQQDTPPKRQQPPVPVVV